MTIKDTTETERLTDIFQRTCCTAWTREQIVQDKLLRFAQAYLMMARAKYRPDGRYSPAPAMLAQGRCDCGK